MEKRTIFIFIVVFAGGVNGNNILSEDLINRSHCDIRYEYFWLMEQYFEAILTVSVIDLLPEDSLYTCTADTFLKAAFPKCEVNIIYRKFPQETIIADYIDPMINSSLDQDYLAKIRINSDYGFGMVFIVENIMTLINFLDSNDIDDITAVDLASANHVVLVTNNCSARKHFAAENFLLKSWQNHFISHMIVLLNDCGDFAFYDVISKGHDKEKNGILKWIDVDNFKLKDVTSLIVHQTINFKEYPIRFAFFIRYASMITEQNLTNYILPSYMKEAFKYSNGFGGVDGIVMSHLVQKLNLKPVFQLYDEANYGAFKKKTGLFDGTLGDVIYNLSDVGMNGRFIKDYGEGTFEATEFLQSVAFESICVVTPKAQEIPKWKAPFLIFNIYSWLGLFLMQITSSVMWFMLKKWEKRKRCLIHKNMHINIKLSELTVETALILFSAPSYLMPSLRQVERILMASFLFMSFYISGVFQASLTSSMSTTSFDSDINTFEQLDKSGLPIWTSSHSLSDLFGENDSYLMESLRKKLKIINATASNMWLAAHSRNICSIERASDSEFMIRTKFMDKNGFPMLHTMQNCPRSYYIGYMVRKGWPFANDFSRIITQFKQGGLIRKWSDDVQQAIINHINFHSITEKNRPVPFSLRHLTFSFYLLGFGLIFSTCVFAMEMFSPKKRIKTH